MNKQELIEHISNTLDEYLKNTIFVKPVLSITEIADSDKVSLEFEINKNCILLDDISYQFGYDQGKFESGLAGVERAWNKPVVPQFVADWYEEHKDDFETNLFRAVDLIPSDYEEGELSEFEEWLVNEHTAPFQTLVNMHQFGFEVEKEKRYRVKAKGVYHHSSVLKLDSITGKWFFGSEKYMFGSLEKHTRKELEEAGFGEVFNSPLFEVEEVE